MRLLELVLCLVWLAPWAWGRFRPVSRKASAFWALAAAAVLLAHVLVETARWPMGLLYVAVFGTLVRSTWRAFRPDREKPRPPRRWWRRVGTIFAVAGLLLTVGLPWLFPIPVLPAPTGSFAVGTQDFEWTDSSRLEIYSDDPSDQRRVVVRVWYPAVPATGVRDFGWRDLSVMSPVFEQFALTPQHSFSGAVWAEGPFPLLLYSPGYGLPLSANTVQMEELASHGYVVAAIGHPYQNPLRFQDGTQIPELDVNQWLKLSPKQGAAKAAEMARESAALATSDETQTRQIFEYFQQNFPLGRTNVQSWTDDSRFVLDQLAALWPQHLNLLQIGAFGHSYGGATAGMLLLQEPRVKAAANLDGWQYGTVLDQNLGRPLLLMEQGGEGADKVNELVYAATSPIWVVKVRNTLHMDFCDIGLLSPLFAVVGNVGWVDRPAVEGLINRSLLSFFDASLQGRGPGLPKEPKADAISTLTYRGQ